MSVGVVNRATTRAASTCAFLTWTQPKPMPEFHPKEEKTVEDEEKQDQVHVQEVEHLDNEEEAKKRREEHLDNAKKQDEENRNKMLIEKIEAESPMTKDLIKLDKLQDLNEETEPKHIIIEDNLPEATLERMEEVQKGWRHVREQPERKKREVYSKHNR